MAFLFLNLSKMREKSILQFIYSITCGNLLNSIRGKEPETFPVCVQAYVRFGDTWSLTLLSDGLGSQR